MTLDFSLVIVFTVFVLNQFLGIFSCNTEKETVFACDSYVDSIIIRAGKKGKPYFDKLLLYLIIS